MHPHCLYTHAAWTAGTTQREFPAQCTHSALTCGRCFAHSWALLHRVFTRHCYIFPLCFFSAPHRPSNSPHGERVCHGCGIGRQGGVDSSAVFLTLRPPRPCHPESSGQKQKTTHEIERPVHAQCDAQCGKLPLSGLLENVLGVQLVHHFSPLPAACPQCVQHPLQLPLCMKNAWCPPSTYLNGPVWNNRDSLVQCFSMKKENSIELGAVCDPQGLAHPPCCRMTRGLQTRARASVEEQEQLQGRIPIPVRAGDSIHACSPHAVE